jgi:hypothetical protein
LLAATGTVAAVTYGGMLLLARRDPVRQLVDVVLPARLRCMVPIQATFVAFMLHLRGDWVKVTQLAPLQAGPKVLEFRPFQGWLGGDAGKHFR